MDIPIFDAILNANEDGIFAVSLVEQPAVERDFIAFKKDENNALRDKPEFKFSIENEVQHMITGVMMLADTPIYRYSPEMGEYYIKFSKETIKEMAEKMLQIGSHNCIDIEHDENYFFDKCNLVECYIKDTAKGVVPQAFADIPDGSLLVTYKVNDLRLWEKITSGEVKGFSLEGFFSFGEKTEMNKQQEKNNNTIMNKIKSVLSKILAEFASVKAVDGTELFYEGEELAVGVEVADADGNSVADGEYELDEKIVVVKDGKVEEIKDKEVVEEEPEAEPEPEVEAEEEEVVVEEEKPAEPEYDAKAEIEALKSEVEALKGEIEAIKEQLQEPVVEPVAEEFEKAVEHGKTGIKNVDKAISILSSMK